MNWLSLGKYVLVVSVASFLVYKIHDSGRHAERAHCLQMQQEFNAQAEQARLDHEAEIIDRNRIHDTILMRVINEKEKLQADLDQRMHELSTGGLWIDARQACPGRHTVSGKTENTSRDDRATGPEKIRLPGEVEGSLLAINYDAAELVDKYNNLRSICLPLVEVVD